jgi:hypothetical protein
LRGRERVRGLEGGREIEEGMKEIEKEEGRVRVRECEGERTGGRRKI